MTQEEINKEAQRLFKLNPKADKCFIAVDGNSFFKEGDAISHQRQSGSEYVAVEKQALSTEQSTITSEEEEAKAIELIDSREEEEAKAIELIDSMKGKSAKEIKKALEKANINTDIINQLIHE